MRLMDELSEPQGRSQSCHDHAGARPPQAGGAGCAGAFFNMFDWNSSKRNVAGRPNSEAVYARRDRSFTERTCNTTKTLLPPIPTNEEKEDAFSTVKSTPSLSCPPSPASVKSDDTSRRVPGVVARLMGLESLPDGTDSSLKSELQHGHSTAGCEQLEPPPVLAQGLLRPEFQDPEESLLEKLPEFPQSPLLSPSMPEGMTWLLDDLVKSLELSMQPSPRNRGCLTKVSQSETGASFRSERKVPTPSRGRAGSLSNFSTKSPKSHSISKPGHSGHLVAATGASPRSQSSRKPGKQDEESRRHFEMALVASTKYPSPNRARAMNSTRVESSSRALSTTDGRKQGEKKQGTDKGEAPTMKRTDSPSKRSLLRKPSPAPVLSPPSTSQCNASQIRKPWRKVNVEDSADFGSVKASQRESSLVACASTKRKFGIGLSKPPVAPLPPLSPDFATFDTAFLDASPIISSEVFGFGPGTFPNSPLVNYEKCFFSSRNHLNLQEMFEVVSGDHSNVSPGRRGNLCLSEPLERVLTPSNDGEAAAQLNTCSSSVVCDTGGTPMRHEIQRVSVDPEDLMMTSPANSKKFEEKLVHDYSYSHVSCVERCRQPSPVSVLENPFLDEGPTTPDASLTDKQLEQDIGGEWNRVSSSYKHSIAKQAPPLKVCGSGFSYSITSGKQGDISEGTQKGEEARVMKHTDSALMRSLFQKPCIAPADLTTNSVSQWNVKAFPDLSKAIKAVEEQFAGFDSQSESAPVDCLPIERMFGRGFSKSNVAALSTTPDFSCFDKPALEISPMSSETFVTDCGSGPGTFPSSPLIMYEKMF